MSTEYRVRLDEAAAFLRPRLASTPRVAVVLGSGLGGLADAVEDPVVIPVAEIPGFGVSTVSGHAGELVLGTMAGLDVLLQNGRVHLYEGFDPAEVVFPVRVMALLGVGTLILTNAAGGIRADLAPGRIMLIKDHINLTGQNPLVGLNLDGIGPRFPDMTRAYDLALGQMAQEAAAEAGVSMQSGVYAALSGPSYETPAEVRMLAILGADAVGMSTVPETLAARHAGMRVLAFSMISNMAAGLGETSLTHDEVLAQGARAGRELAAVILGVCRRLGAEAPA
jgi:purine-nucleoside phosphorylase